MALTKSMNNETQIKKVRKLLQPNRIKILECLYDRPYCVCELTKKLDMQHNLLAHHLKTLKDLGFVEDHRKGRHVVYKLLSTKKQKVFELLDLVNAQ